MKVLEQSQARLVLESRQKVFRILGGILLLVPLMGLITVARTAMKWVQDPGSLPSDLTLVVLGLFAGLFVAGLLLLVYGPYRVTHIFDRESRAYVKESTSVRRTRRVEYPLATFRSVEVQEADEGTCRVVLVSNAGSTLPLVDQANQQRAHVDAVADLVESFLTTA